MNTRYARKDVTVTTFKTSSDAEKTRFKDWALALKPELDGEYGADENNQPLPNSAYLWVLKQNGISEAAESSLYQTFIFSDKNSRDILATGSMVADDRNIGKTYGIQGLGFWGFLNVRRDLRGRGLGCLVTTFMDEHVQKGVDSFDHSANVSLFTRNPVSASICIALGFRFAQQILVAEFNLTEDLYTKTYTPSVLRSAV